MCILNLDTSIFNRLENGFSFYIFLFCNFFFFFPVLGVTRDTPRNEIAKEYRKLARKYHPDLHRDVKDKKDAEENFKRIANA